jgi:hypothetical protein
VNIDRELANRIFLDIGEEMANGQDTALGTLKWRALKDFYLATMITAVSSIPWINGKLRKALTKTDTVLPGENNPDSKPVNYSPYRFMYDLPVDCARPLEIQGDYFYVIENGKLLTDRDNAALLYVTNGKLTVPRTGDDYPDYDLPEMDPLFYEYVEKLIASKLVILLDPSRVDLRQALFAEAMLARQEALGAIRALSSSRSTGERRWDEEIRNSQQDLYLQQLAQNGGRQ